MSNIKNIKKIILVSALGNTIELFDFTLYAALIPLFSKIFFFSGNTNHNFLMSLSVFSVAFFARPLGAILFGFIGDTYGRRKTLIFSVLLMSISTLSIGLIPTCDHIGILAPICLILCRLLQGVSLGGEFASSAIFLMEYLNMKKGLAGGIILSFAVFGALIASHVGHVVIAHPSSEYIWRIPFIAGGCFSILGVYLRIIVDETPEYQILVLNKTIERFPMKIIFKNYLYEFFLVMGICMYAGVISYTLLAYVPIHLSRFLAWGKSEILISHYFGLIAFAISAIGFGFVADRTKHTTVGLFAVIAGIVSAIPIFLLMQTKELGYLIVSQLWLGILAGSYCSSQFAFINDFFPTRIKCSALSFAHGMGIALLGGTFPMIVVTLIHKFDNSLMAGIYLSFCGVIGFVFFLLGIRRQRIKIISLNIASGVS